jgi:hypothetical protein
MNSGQRVHYLAASERISWMSTWMSYYVAYVG